ncbi:arsinothricin resistance N-acetyltransferase ArsN1 family B [Uliginosibacterium paludis]|uniref:Arsinothricin resistance N-acetyltransferase ArsN1 family B n=1 Tax=Uliginosibacterium paludis TaxID=1615952 RepID=A0ABV2CP38_9RHOO
MIRSACPSDAADIATIYNHYITGTTVSFEEAPVSTTEMENRLKSVSEASLPWLVFEEDGQLKGYAYASKWKPRSAYRFSVESSVYLRHDCTGRGLGRLLYEALFAELARRGIHSVIGGVALPNEASVALHEKLGMKKIAHFEEVGFKFGKWLDVAYWQKRL